MGQAKWHKPDTSLLFFEEQFFSSSFHFFYITSVLLISGRGAGSSVPVRGRETSEEH